MTVPLRSVIDPVLPRGYGFCIIDGNGEVLFHSDKGKNLNQNFIGECSSSDLRASIIARNPMQFDALYEGHDCQMYASPIKQFPYTIVTFYDQSIADRMNGQVFGASVFLVLLLLLSGALLLGLLYVLGRGRRARGQRPRLRNTATQLRIPRFEFSRFAPIVEETGKSPAYLRTTLFNIMLLLVLWLFSFFTSHPKLMLFICYGSVFYGIFINFQLLQPHNGKKFFRQFPGLSAVWIFVALLGNVSAVQVLDQYGLHFIAYELCIIGAWLIAFSPWRKVKVLKKLSQEQLYYYLMLSWLILACVLPSVRFCEVLYNKENFNAVQLSQLEFSKDLNAKIVEWQDVDPDRYLGSNDSVRSTYERVLNNGQRYDNPQPTQPAVGERVTFDSTITWLRFMFHRTPASGKTLGSAAFDKRWYWRNLQGYHGRRLLFTAALPPRDGKADSLRLSSGIGSYHYPFFNDISIKAGGVNLWGIFFWLIMVLFLYVLYVVIRFFVRRIFVLDLPASTNLRPLDKQFYEGTKVPHRLFIIGLPYSGKTEYFRDALSKFKPVEYIDLADAGNTAKWNSRLFDLERSSFVDSEKEHTGNSKQEDLEKTWVLDHFEYDQANAEICSRKLELLELLTRKGASRIIIVSTSEPDSFIYPPPAKGQKNKEEREIDERWSKVLVSFCKFYYPLYGMQDTPPVHFPGYGATHWLKEFIHEECRCGLFLQNIAQELYDYVDANPHEHITQDEIILKVQELAYSYYQTIWHTLSREERYVLFDLAQDGLVNSKNIDTISRLMSKGLIRSGNQPHLMNKSFRNFILCAILPEEFDQLEHDARTKGSWSNLRTPLMVMVAAMVLFIFKTQENEVAEYLTTFAAALPILIRLIMSLADAAQKKTKVS